MLAIFAALEAENKSIADFMDEITTNAQYYNHPAVTELRSSAVRICTLLDRATQSSETSERGESEIRIWATGVVLGNFQQELQGLMNKSNKWRFGAMHSKAQQIEEFKIEDMASTMNEQAPCLWNALGGLLQANENNLEDSQTEESKSGEYWDNVDEMDLEGIIDHIIDDPASLKSRRAARRRALITVVRYYVSNSLSTS